MNTGEIVNRVSNSKLVVIDLEDYYPSGQRVLIDIKDWLFEGLVLREKEFRQQLDNHDWHQYNNSFVAIYCSSEAIVPAWAFMLLTIKLEPFCKKIILGDLEQLETVIYQDIINSLDVTDFKDKSIIIKGCSKKPVPKNAYMMLTQKITPLAKSVMYGEACSSVPLYKRGK